MELPVFQVCLSARCLTLTGAGDECNLWQPMELTDSWESSLPAVKVSIFKAHQLQWEGSRAAHMPALTVKQKNFLLSVYCYTTQIQTKTHTHSGQPLCKETSTKPRSVIVKAVLFSISGWIPLSYLHECHKFLSSFFMFQALIERSCLCVVLKRQKLHSN